MKTLRNLGSVFAMIILSAVAGYAQSATTPVNPKFDAELAKKLGADDMGLRPYVLAILKTGPNDATIKGEERTKLFQGHFANMTRLANEGKLAVAGPFGQNDKSFRGLFILAVPNVEAAKALADTDPTVKAGVFVVEYVPWYGTAALMQVTETHGKIAKKSM
jgi:uncharacterized protein YciI